MAAAPFEALLPPSGSGPGVLVLHAWWGLNDAVRDYGRALSAKGFVVGLPDLYEGKVATTLEGAEALRNAKPRIAHSTRLKHAIAALGKMREVDSERIGLVGFSLGGWLSLGLARDAKLPLGAVVAYYATRNLAFDAIPAKVIAHFAESDPFEPDEDRDAMMRAMPKDASWIYPGTTHWFAEADRPEHVPAAAKAAFDRTVAFLERTLR